MWQPQLPNKELLLSRLGSRVRVTRLQLATLGVHADRAAEFRAVRPPLEPEQRLRIQRRRLVRAGGEFGIVVVGVIVALAADGWREDLVDRRAERDYLARLAADLELGRTQLEGQRRRHQRVLDVSSRMMDALEEPGAPDSLLLDGFQAVARSGFVATVLVHDATYRELTTTGQLMIIQDAAFRQQLVDYYGAVSRLIAQTTEFPQGLSDRFTQLTGYYPYVFDRGDVELTPSARARLLREVRDSSGLHRELRELNARLVITLPGFDRVELTRDSLAGALR